MHMILSYAQYERELVSENLCNRCTPGSSSRRLGTTALRRGRVGVVKAHAVRPVAAVLEWGKQRGMWKPLIQRPWL